MLLVGALTVSIGLVAGLGGVWVEPTSVAANEICEPLAANSSETGGARRAECYGEWRLQHVEMLRQERRMLRAASALAVSAGLLVSGVGFGMRRYAASRRH